MQEYRDMMTEIEKQGSLGPVLKQIETAVAGTCREIMLMCDKVTHKNLIDDSPLFRKTQDIITCPALCFCFQID